MCKEETELIEEDIYFFGYNMLMQILKEDDPKKGLEKYFYFSKIFLKADDIVLYKLSDEDLKYKHINNQSMMVNNSSEITDTLNKLSITETLSNIIEVTTELNGQVNNYTFIPISDNDDKYIIAISNINLENKASKEKFFEILTSSLNYLIKKNNTFKFLKDRGEIDELTGLQNRTSYTDKTKELDNNLDPFVFSMFDILRLKFVNDQYGHDYGDIYIKKITEILNKYYPRYKYQEESTGLKRKIPTGNNIYRIGGDEFVLITTSEPKELVDAKNLLIAEEASKLDLGLNEPLITGIEYGTAERTYSESIKEIYKQADDELRENKTIAYKRLKIDRRR